MSLPEAPRDLHRMLAVRLGGAALVIGIVAGGVAYRIEERRVETVALELAATGARHFASPAMRALPKGQAAGNHVALSDLLGGTNFVGIRIYDARGTQAYETWADPTLRANAALRAHRHTWPALGRDHRNWIRVGDEQLIQVVLPLVREGNVLEGYLEGIYRLDEQTRARQRAQIVGGVLIAIGAVFATALMLYPLLRALLGQATRLTSRLLDANLALIRSLGNAVAKRDSDTDAHNYRVTLYAIALAERLGWSRRDVGQLIAGAFLHDVGKIGIPDQILLKPGKLTDEEFAVMKSHALLGLDIVAGNAWMEAAAPVIRNHHEHFDGSGYPDGLKGNDIPRGARLFAIVDVFDALVSRRPYKPPMPAEDALAALEQDAGRHFDPELLAAFGAIALHLYREIGLADEAKLHDRMRAALAANFALKTPSDPIRT